MCLSVARGSKGQPLLTLFLPRSLIVPHVTTPRAPLAASTEGELHDAAERGDVKAIKRLVKQRGFFGRVPVDINGCSGEEDNTPLHWAAHNGHVEALQALVVAGADLDARTKFENTPLHLAAWNGHVEALQALVAAGADLGARNQDDMTPLHCAAQNGHVEALQALVAAGADLGARNKEDATPLHLAAWNGHVEAVRELVAAGADLGAKSKDDITPLHCAAGKGHVEALQVLVAAGADLGARSKDDWTPLHLAAINGYVEALQALVAAGADLGARTKDGRTPLDVAKTDEVRQALAALPQRPPAVPPPAAASTLASSTPPRLQQQTQDSSTTQDPPAIPSAPTTSIPSATRARPRVLYDAANDVGRPFHAPTTATRGLLPAADNASGGDVSDPMWLQNMALAHKVKVHTLLQDQHNTDVPDLASHPQPPAGTAQDPPRPRPPPPAGNSLVLYTGSTVTLASPLTPVQTQSVVKALAVATFPAAVKLAVGMVTCNPVALIMASMQLLKAVHGFRQQGRFSQQRLQRMAARFAAMEPALAHLAKELRPPLSTATPLNIVHSLCASLLLLDHVMVQVQELHSKLQTQGARMLQRMLELLKAGGCEQEVAALDLELRDAVTQLSAILSIAHFTKAAETLRAREELQVAAWQRQNEADRPRDLQQLEGLVVEAVGGVQALQQQLAEQRVVLDGQVVGLQQVAEWLQRMQAGNSLIMGHLQRLNSKVDKISSGVADMQLDVSAVKDQMAQLVAILLPPKQGQPRPKRVPMAALPDLALPRERIQVARDLQGALADAKRGAFGKVVQAVWAGHQVAVKVYNITGLGMRDCKDAVHEAVLLCKANHPNVVRCYGVVYDPDSAAQDSIQGSLVMEWVEGGSLYDWLQDEAQDKLGLAARVLVAVRVAEGMRHLGEKRLVHGDLKPQNVLMTSVGATAGVPQVKICDFGLATYTSTTTHSTSKTPRAAYTPAYTSPERLRDPDRRSPQDDVYAFGILLYFIATGRTPYKGTPADRLERAIERGKRPDIDRWLQQQAGGSQAEREVAAAYCQLAQRCWAAEAGHRPTFEALLGELWRMLHHLQRQLL